MRLESEEEKEVVAWAKRNGWYTRKLKWIGRVAGPDRFFAKDGKPVFMEMKRRGEPLNPTQEREIARMIRKGLDACWFDNAEDAIEYLESH
jgi:hypothetical protein